MPKHEATRGEEASETALRERSGSAVVHPHATLPDGAKLAPGHLSAAADRFRTQKDSFATNLTTNILPQHPGTNNGPWKGLEQELRTRARNGEEFYIIAGGHGTHSDKSTIDRGTYQIHIPSHTWKVVVALDSPGAEVTTETEAFAVFMPNQNIAGNSWRNYQLSINELERRTGYDLLHALPDDLEELLENRDPLSANLLATDEAKLAQERSFFSESAIRHYRFSNIGSAEVSVVENSVCQIGFVETSTNQSSSRQVSTNQFNSLESNIGQVSPTQVRLTEVNPFKIASGHVSPSEAGTIEVDVEEGTIWQTSSTEVSLSKVDFPESNVSYYNSPEINVSQSFSLNRGIHIVDLKSQKHSSKISLSSSIAAEQFPEKYFLHNSVPQTLNDLNSTAQTVWTSHLNNSPPVDLTLQITDLPAGQLAEAQLTQFHPSGQPSAGTLSIDHNANGIGWFIDPTPFDHSEFSQPTSEFSATATPDSPAHGQYDLLTTLLHETAHLYGWIAGYEPYDTYRRSSPYTFTPDGSHLDPTAHPHDLLNPTLTPGVRKLPSALNLEILNAVTALAQTQPHRQPLSAPLTADPLRGLINGDFSDPAGWTSRGDTTLLDEQAVLSEDSPYLSHLSQTFHVPQGATALQFTLVETQLGNSELAPPDALEVALLDAQTRSPLASSVEQLSHTDALLNLQHDGSAYFSEAVTLPDALTSGERVDLNVPRTVQIDLSHVAPGTEATLSFDLLGFGERDAQVIIDDAVLITTDTPIPVASADQASTTQNQSVVIDVLANDNGNLNPDSILATAPSQGEIVLNPDGKVTYTPSDGFVGNDSFTYSVANQDGVRSNSVTVTIEVTTSRARLWGINEDDKHLFSIEDHTSPIETHTDYGRLWVTLNNQQVAVGSPLAFTIGSDNRTAYLAVDNETEGLSSPWLGRLDLATVQAGEPVEVTFVGNFDPAAKILGLDFDPLSGQLYGVLTQTGTDQLVVINPDNGQIEHYLGSLQNDSEQVERGEDLVFDDLGQLYAIDNDDDKLYRVNKTDGEILETLDAQVADGLSATSSQVEALAWDGWNQQMLFGEEQADELGILTLETGNNRVLAQTAAIGLTDVEGMDFRVTWKTSEAGITSAAASMESELSKRNE